jgi:N-methylhydantoinase B
MASWVWGADRFVGREKEPDEVRIADPNLRLHQVKSDTKLDPVTYEVIRHRLWQINEEQRVTISRVSGSSIATDANDFNVCICNEVGDIVILGSGITDHVCESDLVIKWILEERSDNPGVHEGDMFLTNDPWIGAVHQNDVTVQAPLFIDGELFCWTVSTIHQIDVGGTNAGSFCFDATDVFSEGTVIPVVKIVENGRLRKDAEDLYLRQSRTPALLALDLRAFIAGHNVVHSRLRQLIQRYGPDIVKAVMQKTMDDSEREFRARLRELPDGVWRHEEYHDSARAGDKGVYAIRLAVSKEDDTLTFDFRGTDEQAGIINCAYAGLKGGVLGVVLSTLCSDIPWAVGGINRALRFETEPGTVNNAEFPAGVSAAAVAALYQTMNVTTIGVAKMLASHPRYREYLLAGTAGSWATMYFYGIDQRQQPFVNIIMDAMAGGIGARAFKDGDSTGGIICCPIGQIPNVETNELQFPILYLYRRERIDSGGPGKFRGGAGGEIGLLPHKTDAPINWEWFAFGQAFPTANGLCGGWPTKAVDARLHLKTDTRQRFARGSIPAHTEEANSEEELFFAPKGSYAQSSDDLFHCYWQGGGGFGDPLDRDPEAVLKDVLNRYVSVEAAERIYGVVVNTAEKRVDTDATLATRDRIRNERTRLPIWEDVDGNGRE